MLRIAVICFMASIIGGSSVAADVSDLGWLAGCWSIEGQEDGSGEMWTRPMGDMLLGIGYISKEGKVVSHEYMRIERRPSGDIYFVAKPSGQAEAEFKMSDIGESHVMFENPAHDFPQRIIYRLESEGVLSVRVEAADEGGVRGFELKMHRSKCSE